MSTQRLRGISGIFTREKASMLRRQVSRNAVPDHEYEKELGELVSKIFALLDQGVQEVQIHHGEIVSPTDS